MNKSLPDFLSFNYESEDITVEWPNLPKEDLLNIARDLHNQNKFYKNLIYSGGRENEPVDGVVVVYFDNETSRKSKPKIDKLFDRLFSSESDFTKDDFADDEFSGDKKSSKRKNRNPSKPFSVHYAKSFTISSDKSRKETTPPNYSLSKSSTPPRKPEPQSERRAFNKKRFLCDSQAGNIDLFSDHKPGIISDELRNALGLKRHELPVHIYKMRMFGYPPGWERRLLETRKISIDNVITYKGFNTPPSPKDIDLSCVYGCPVFSSSWSKQNYVYYLKDYLKKHPLPVSEERKSESPLKRSLPESVSSPKVLSDLGNPIMTERTLIGLESTLLIRGERSLPPIENFSDGLMPLVLQDEREAKAGGGGYARCMRVLGKNVNRPK